MCYSAQVIQVVRKLHRDLGIRLDYEEAFRLFMRRLDDPSVVISRGFEANFDEPVNEQERRIKAAVDEHRSRAATKFEKELEDVRIATSKIEALTTKLRALRNYEPTSEDNRIFPMVYAGVIVKQGGESVLTPMRYFCRPAGNPAFYDKKFPGLYNARRDNLEKFWGEQFGHHHAVMVVENFYENVKLHAMEHRELRAGEQETNVVLQFTPDPPRTMFIACVWSHWTDPKEPDVRGFAAITDEPPADVAAAGHDRCIINLKPEHVDAWLTPEGRSADELQAILSDRVIPVIQHPMAA
jgi:putative SOS response-associated peptidase YedK